LSENNRPQRKVARIKRCKHQRAPLENSPKKDFKKIFKKAATRKTPTYKEMKTKTQQVLNIEKEHAL
jgi:hypothetical protein